PFSPPPPSLPSHSISSAIRPTSIPASSSLLCPSESICLSSWKGRRERRSEKSALPSEKTLLLYPSAPSSPRFSCCCLFHASQSRSTQRIPSTSLRKQASRKNMSSNLPFPTRPESAILISLTTSDRQR
ncbi:hypothetical protein PMAYCL1PPCAC_07594, partial [Pristionchus mayeri]